MDQRTESESRTTDNAEIDASMKIGFDFLRTCSRAEYLFYHAPTTNALEVFHTSITVAIIDYGKERLHHQDWTSIITGAGMEAYHVG
jgi:hypothetical protein